MNIYVGNLSQETSEDQLREIFSAFGEVDTAKIIKDNFTGFSKGFGFVEMNNKQEGEKAVEELNNTELDTKSIIVNEARPKASNFGGGGSFRSNNNNRRY